MKNRFEVTVTYCIDDTTVREKYRCYQYSSQFFREKHRKGTEPRPLHLRLTNKRGEIVRTLQCSAWAIRIDRIKK